MQLSHHPRGATPLPPGNLWGAHFHEKSMKKHRVALMVQKVSHWYVCMLTLHPNGAPMVAK